MPKPLLTLIDSIPTHHSVGAIIRNGDQYLLIDRTSPPFGFACVAGHIDEGETPIEALRREVFEESGLQVIRQDLLIEKLVLDNTCSKNISQHYWYVYACEHRGSIARNIRETKSIGWYTIDELKKLTLEPVWKNWLTQLQILPQ